MMKKPLKLTVAILTVIIMLLGMVPGLNLPSSKVYAEDSWQVLGEQGAGLGQYNEPSGIAIDSANKVYIADYGNNRIQAISFNAEGVPSYTEVLTNDTEINSKVLTGPRDVAVDGSGNLYITDSENQRILKGTKNGESYDWSEVAGTFRSNLRGIAADNDGNLFVADNDFPGTNHLVRIGEKMGDGSYNWTAINEGDVSFGFIYGIFVDGEGNLYVADNHNGIQIGYEGEVSFDYSWGRVFDVNSLSGVAVDCNDAYYYAVDDSDANKIHKYQTHTGSRIESWGVYGDDGQPGHFCYAYDIAINSQGDMFVVDQGKHNIQVLKAPPPAPAADLAKGSSIGTTKITGLVEGTVYEYVCNWDSDDVTWDSATEATAQAGGIIDNIFVDASQYIHIRVKDPVSAVKVLDVEASHIKQELTPAQSVAADKASLSEANFTFGGSDNKDSVTQNFTVPLSGANSTTISWSEASDYLAIAADTGAATVTRPANGSGNSAVTLTATISKDDKQDTKTLSVTILEEPAPVQPRAWQSFGPADFSAGTVDHTSTAVDDGTCYVAFSDAENGNKATVMKSTGGAWSIVGSAGFSEGEVSHVRLIAEGGNLYIAYSDAAYAGKATVMKFDGTSWVNIGAPGFTTYGTIDMFSFAVHNSTPYIAYRSLEGGGSYYGYVVKYDSVGETWSSLGGTGEIVRGIEIAVDSSDVPYILFRTNGNAATVKKHTGDTWLAVGLALGTTTSSGGNYLSLYLDGTAPYAAYGESDDDGKIKPTVKRWDGVTWNTLGSEKFYDDCGYLSLKVSENVPYLAFIGVSNKATVMKYNGTAWETVGDAGFSSGSVRETVLCIDNGELYVGYKDFNTNKPTVQKYAVAASSDADDVAADLAGLAETDFTFGGSDNKDSITQNFTVPLSGANGTTISWSVVSGSDYVSINGDTGLVTVTRPENADGDATVVLSAAISKGSENDTKQLTVKIIKKDLQPEAPAEGDGSENTPYLITDAANMLWLAQQVNGGESFSGAYFKQTADIDLAGIDNFTPIGNSETKYFSGIYDGDNKKITNLTISAQVSEPATADANKYFGLFGYLSEAELKNVILEDAGISIAVEQTGANPENKILAGYIGGTAGFSANSTLENCRVVQSGPGESAIEVTEATGRTRLYVGGVVGYFNYGGDTEAVINRCVNEAQLSGSNNSGWRNYFGGITGFYHALGDNRILQNSYNTGDITISGDNALQTNYAGGITACKWDNTIIQKTYNTGNISISGPGTSNCGGIIGESNGSAISGNFYLTGTANFGIGSTSSDEGAAPKTDEELKTTSTFSGWDATIWNLVAGSYPGLKLTVSADPAPNPNPAPPSSGSGGDDSSTPPAQTEDRTVPVIVQDGQGNQLPPSNLAITRENRNGTVTDKVEFTEAKAGETVSQARENNKDTAVIYINEVPGQRADAIQVDVPGGAVGQLAGSNMALNIVTDKAQIEIPKDTITAMQDQDIKLEIREQKDTTKVNETKGLMVQLASGSDLVGSPLVIESNVSTGVLITLPLDGAVVPNSESQLEAFLNSLAVLIEHSDGENKIDKGQIKYDENGKPVGISIWVNKFSTFTVIGLPEYPRISGTDRIKTAEAISREGWPDSAEAVILANAYEFADALAGVTLGGLLDGPILLTAGDSLAASTLAEVSRLKAKDIYIVGGMGAVSQGIEDSLKSKGYNVYRLSGADRFSTAVEIGNSIVKSQLKSGQTDTVFLAYGYNFADALSCATFAAENNYPILLTRTNHLDPGVNQALADWKVKNVIIVGGSGVVDNGVEAELKALDLSVTRLGGEDRYQTAKRVMEYFSPNPEKITLTTGLNFPDSLAGAILAAKKDAPIMIFNQKNMTAEVKSYVKTAINKNKPFILGGDKALPLADLFFDVPTR